MASLQNLRFRCAVCWIQSFYDDVTFPFPREVLSYPYTDLYTSTVRPELISCLTQGTPYFRLVAHIRSLPYGQIASFDDAINRLPQPDIDLDAFPLASCDPFVMEQHLALVECVMKLYYSTFLSLDFIAMGIQRLSGAVQSVSSVEDGLLDWLRVVCGILRRRDKIHTPELESLSSSLSNGCLLLLLLHFYIPHCIQLSNGKFSPDGTLGLEDAFHNATLVSNACTQVADLKFCLSPQGIVRSGDPVLSPYVLVSLSSLFICFQVSDSAAIYRPPTLYGALIDQSRHTPKLRASPKFHSMDSVARIGTHSRGSSVARNLITPSTENLLSALHSNPPVLYPRSDRGMGRFRTKSSSTPELSQTVLPSSGTSRQQNVLKISSECDAMPVSVSSQYIPEPRPVARREVEVFPEVSEPREGWSPCEGVNSHTSSSEVSLDGRGSVSSQFSEVKSGHNTRNMTPEDPKQSPGIRLHIFPVARESPARDPISLLLRMEANRIRADQSAERCNSSKHDVIRQQLGQLAFSYLTANQDLPFEAFIQSKLGLAAEERDSDHGCSATEAPIPSCTPARQVEAPSDSVSAQIEESENTHIDLTPDKSSKPTSFYVTGAGVPADEAAGPPSPFVTERARNRLKMLENRNLARQVSKQPTLKPEVPHSHARPAPTERFSPSASCHSMHSNPPVPSSGNHRVVRGKRFGSANDVTAHSAPKHKSNKQIIKNAISDVCLAGGPNAAKKVEVLRSLVDTQSDQFLILFRDIIGCKFRGLYAYQADTETARRIGGSGPRVVSQDMLVKLYKYNSGAKEFQEIPARRISFSTDGITILDNLWGGRRKS